jgi:hypothetical protein
MSSSKRARGAKNALAFSRRESGFASRRQKRRERSLYVLFALSRIRNSNSLANRCRAKRQTAKQSCDP